MYVFRSGDVITGVTVTDQPNVSFPETSIKSGYLSYLCQLKSVQIILVVTIFQAQTQGSFAHFLCIYLSTQGHLYKKETNSKTKKQTKIQREYKQ